MKLLCDACGQVVPLTQMRQVDGALVFACRACGVEGRIEAEGDADRRGQETAPTGRVHADRGGAGALQTAAPASPALTVIAGAARPVVVGPPPNHCPKCIERHAEGALICRRCGLVFANFEPSLVAPREELVRAWRELHAQWDDAASHERVVRLAAQWGALAELGRLYRIRLAIDPDDVRAREGRERIISLAASTALPSTPERKLEAPPTVSRNGAYVLLAALVIGIAGLLYWMAKR